MPTSLEIAGQVTVTAPPQQVWDAAVDWSRQSEWMMGTRVRGGSGRGATLIGWTGIGPVGFTDTMVITEWDPPRRCTVTHTGRVVRGRGVFEVTPRGAGSRFRWAEHLELPLPAATARLVAAARPLAQWGLNSSLKRFARLLAPS